MALTRLKTREINLGDVSALIPYWAFIDDCIVQVDGRFTAGLKLRGIDIDCISNNQLESIHDRIRSFLDSLPQDIELQFIYQIGMKNGVRSTDVYLFITQSLHSLNSPFKGIREILKNAMTQAATEIGRQEHERQVIGLQGLCTQIAGSLAQIGVSSVRLGSQELFELAYRFLNPTRSKLIQAPQVAEKRLRLKTDGQEIYAAEYTAREQLAFSGIFATPQYCYLDGLFLKVVTLKLLPKQETSAALIRELLGTSIPCMISVNVQSLKSSEYLGTLRRRENVSTVLTSLAGHRRNYDAEAERNDVQGVLEETASGGERLFGLTLSVLVAEKTIEALEERVPAILQFFLRMNGAEGATESFTYPEMALSFLPGNGHANFRKHICLTSNVAAFLPVYETWRGTKKGIMVRGRRGELIRLDPFDRGLDAFNAIVIGSTGSGKSFSTIYLLNSFRTEDCDIIIVDVGGSYKRFVELYNGAYLEVKLDDRYALNPFFPREEILQEGKFVEVKLGFLSALIQRMTEDEGEKIGKIGQGIIDRALRVTYQKHTLPIFSDFQCVLEGYGEISKDADDTQQARRLSKKLSIWTTGPYAQLINRPTTIDISNRLVCFDLKGLSEFKDLQSVVTMILSGLVWSTIMKSNKPTLIVFDEVWQQLGDATTSRFIEELYRTTRKYNASVISISQALDDFLSSSSAPAIITNSSVRYILKVNEDLGKLQKSFFLNDREIYLVKELRKEKGSFSEIFLSFGSQRAVIRIIPTPEEYWICTSDARDREQESLLKKERPDLTGMEVIRELARLYPKGV